MSKTKILFCFCKHADQDAMYGIGKRVHNAMKPGSGKFRCTVCSSIVVVESEMSLDLDEGEKK